jgi:tight adherence protein C
MNGDVILMLGVFGVVSSLVLMLCLLIGHRGQSVEMRLADLSRQSDHGGPLRSVSSWLPSLGALLMPHKKANREHLQVSLVQAGFYRRHTSAMFFGMKLLLMVCPLVVGLALSSLGLLSLTNGVFLGSLVGLAGTLAPGVWLRRLKAGRQKKIRRALPDALDVIVICLEGGLSLPAAFARVSDELQAAYPMLAAEMLIIRKEIELGRSTGEAFRDFADRFGADELRSMAALIDQAERFGASLVRTLRIQADALRLKRHQYAETQAQKAPLKLIFPTVLCIFPALYIVLMGPAGVQLLQLLENIHK